MLNTLNIDPAKHKEIRSDVRFQLPQHFISIIIIQGKLSLCIRSYNKEG